MSKVIGLPSVALQVLKTWFFLFPVAFFVGILLGSLGIIMVPIMGFFGSSWDTAGYFKLLEL
jgi:hypothetical protein